MYLNGYSVRVPGGNESDGYVELDHGQTYALALRNTHRTRCDARVEIDGKDVGTWRLNASGSITLERPAHDQGCFTFYKLGTSEGHQAGLDGASPDLGLVKVTFTPERQREPVYRNAGAVAKGITLGGDSVTMGIDVGGTRSAGGTGLSGHSHQRFHTVANLDYDYSRQTVIHLRLVCRDSGPRPLTAFSTPVPPRVN